MTSRIIACRSIIHPGAKKERNKAEILYRMRSNTTYTESLNTLDDREDQNYEENVRATKPVGVHQRKQVQEYMREVEENNPQQCSITRENSSHFVKSLHT